MGPDAVGNPPMKRNQEVCGNLQKRLERLLKDFIEKKNCNNIHAFLQEVGKSYSPTSEAI